MARLFLDGANDLMDDHSPSEAAEDAAFLARYAYDCLDALSANDSRRRYIRAIRVMSRSDALTLLAYFLMSAGTSLPRLPSRMERA